MKFTNDFGVSVNMGNKRGCSADAVVVDRSSAQIKKMEVPVKFIAKNGCINVHAKGYNKTFNNEILTIEIWDGKLRLLVWADKNSDEATHIIDLENAKEIKKKK